MCLNTYATRNDANEIHARGKKNITSPNFFLIPFSTTKNPNVNLAQPVPGSGQPHYIIIEQ